MRFFRVICMLYVTMWLHIIVADYLGVSKYLPKGWQLLVAIKS